MRRSTLATALVAVFIVSYLGTPAAVKTGGYVATDLVVNKSPLTDRNGIVHKSKVQDPNLANPWGVAETPTGSPFWVSDNAAGVSTLYNVPANAPNSAAINPRVVSIPTPVDLLGKSGAPTGAVFNITTLPGSTPGFMISGVKADGVTETSAPAIFIFATEDGTIVGWNPGVNPKGFNLANAGNYGIIAVDNSGNNFTVPPSSATGAVYKGLAIATDAKGVTRLYATNFRSGMVEMYDVNFHALTSPPAFVDPKLPDSYAPFNIVPINGLDDQPVHNDAEQEHGRHDRDDGDSAASRAGSALFVTFAKQNAEKHDDVAGQGHGIVDVFDLDGTLRQRFAQHGQLDSPWGVALAPTGFGELGGGLWIGNFGNGHINAFDPESGRFLGKVRDPKGKAILIDGLWTITFGSGNGNGGATNTLYFTAGPNGETDGLFGSLNPN
jgi:uncharacterized protein (TIGR03118 family)